MTSAPSPGGPSWQQEPAASHPSGRPASSSFFRWIRGLDITRTPDRWVGGVAGGVARRTGLDLALVRGLIVVLAVFGGIGVLLYGLAWALLPEPDGRIHVEQAGRGSWTSGLTGAAVLVAIGLWHPNLSVHDGGDGGLLWTLFWIGAVVLFVYWIVNRSGRGSARPGVPGGGPAAPGGGGPGSSQPPTPPFGPVPYGSAEPPTPASGPSGSPGSPGVPPEPGATPGPADQAPPLPGASQSSATTHPLPYQPAPWAEWSAYPAADPVRSRVVAPESVGPPDRRYSRPSGSATALLLGGATITAAVLLALDYTGVLDIGNATAVAPAAAAVVLAVGIIALGVRGRSSGLVGVTAALATIGALTASFTVGGGFWVVAEETTTTPASLRVASDGYSVLAAHAIIDLAGLPAPARDVVVPVNSLASAVTVIVPADMPVEVRTRMALGRAGTVGTMGTAGTDSSSSALQGDGGVLQFGNGELNAEADGAGLILDVRGAMSDVTILTTADADVTSTPPNNGTTPTGDTP